MRRKAGKVRLVGRGGLELPENLASELGLEPGYEIAVEPLGNSGAILKSFSSLAKLYIEPTNHCNLDCEMCMRRAWKDVAMGFMEWSTFERIMEGVSRLPRPPIVFFGGYGEPLLHPQIVPMVERAKEVGCHVEMVTNGTLLDRSTAVGLIKARLDRLWVSLDGVTSKGYGSMRPSSPLESVLENISTFRDLATGFRPFALPKPAMGIVFVATRRNLKELPQVASLASRLNVTELLVTNVLPHTQEMEKEALFASGMSEVAFEPSIFRLSLPRMDTWELGRPELVSLFRSGFSVCLAGADLSEAHNRCPFVENGSLVVGWRGDASPCLPLLYDHIQYLSGFQRHCRRFILGNIEDMGLEEIWNEEANLLFRKRVLEFPFSLCTVCGGCDMLESNQEDCFGNEHPTCGACLFAQGIVVCP